MNKRKRYRKGRNNTRNKVLGIILLLLIVIVIFILIKESVNRKKSTDESEIQSVNEAIDDGSMVPDFINELENQAVVTKYYTYGTHFNIEGSISLTDSLDPENIEKISLLFLDVKSDKVSDEPMMELNMYYTYEDNELDFYTSKVINEGVDLENLENGVYSVAVRIKYSGDNEFYYAAVDDSGEDDINYYTLTDVNSTDVANDLIVINHSEKAEKKYMFLSSFPKELSEETFDIVIDAGHGGTDTGAINGEYTEADIVLEIALKTADLLEEAGYSVCLTRDGSESEDEAMAYTMYDEDGRVNVACASKAKYALSIHLNSITEFMPEGGVQIYCSTRSNTDLAKNIADNLVTGTGTTYSSMETDKLLDGVYKNSYDETEIDEAAQLALNKGYEEYNITADTDYLFMIRELGGIATNAYVDGRNTTYGTNLYWDSNQGVECCLCELGFMSVDNNLAHIINNEDDYAAALADALISQIENDKE
jgi:N-acetylmuramoyl-L-alanine amidase